MVWDMLSFYLIFKIISLPEQEVCMTQKLSNSKLKDNSSKIIFGNPELCAQFLRDKAERNHFS